jgi:hypothetical protein
MKTKIDKKSAPPGSPFRHFLQFFQYLDDRIEEWVRHFIRQIEKTYHG